MFLLLAMLACHSEKARDTATTPLVLVASGAMLDASREGLGALHLEGSVLGDDLTLDLEVEGDHVVPRVSAGAEGGLFEGLVLSGLANLDGQETPRLWRQGYQSWSWAGVLELQEVHVDKRGLPQAGGDGEPTSFLQDDPASSWWLGLVGRPDGASLLLGVESTRKTKFYTAFSIPDANGEVPVWAVWGGMGEAIPLAPGATLALDPLWLDLGDGAFGLHRAYAEAVATAVSAPPLPPPPPAGWATWYFYYEAVTEADVRANLARALALNARGDLAPIGLFQVDDGWEQRWGDWTANDRFPSGMPALAADIRAAGMVPGLWMAPFYVSRESNVYLDHPDWWVRDAKGDDIVYSNSGTGDYVIIDATHPEAGPWMAAQVADRRAEGWDYLKLDFLYAGAQEGWRHADVTGMEAFHLGMGLIREAAGDAWILACGAPLLPSVGYVQSFRTGTDIALTTDHDPRPAYVRWQARSTAGRTWTNGLWWWNDPDQVLVRESLDASWVRGSIVGAAVAGGTWILGDDLTALPEDRLVQVLNPGIVALMGTTFQPEAPLEHPSGWDLGPAVEFVVPDDDVPGRWFARGDEPIIAIVNLSDEATEEVSLPGREVLSDVVRLGSDTQTLESGEGQVWMARP